MTLRISRGASLPVAALLVAMLATVTLPMPSSLSGQEATAEPPTLTDLRAFADTGVVLQDRNGDDVLDFVDVKILLSPWPLEAEVAAAANLAARLGYETSALNLGLAEKAGVRQRSSSPVVVIGTRAVDAAGLADDSSPLRGGLAPGQGVLAYMEPVGMFQGGVVAVVGYDATGLLEASAYLSGRYPAVWTPDGTVWREVAEKVEEFVASRDIDGASVTLDRVVVDASQPGVARGRVTVRVPDGASFETAVDAFLGKDSVAVDAETDAAEGEGATGADAAAVDAAQPAMDSPAEEEDPDTAQAEEPPSLEDLEFKDLHRLDVRIVGPGTWRTVTLRPEDPWGTKTDGAFRPGSDQPFSLPGLYAVGGLYRDTNRDLVPDETAAYLSLSGAGAAGATVDLATRIGLETAGIRLPLARIAAQENDPTTLGFPILMGTDHYQIDRLREEGKLPATDVDGGEGFVQLVDNAFGEKGAMAVGGADEDGLGAITDWVARRVPYLWQYGKGEYRLADAETEVRRFLQGRKAPGQLALALTKLGVWMDRMAEDPPSRVEVELAAEKAPDGLADLAADVIRERFPGAQVDVRTFPTGFGVGDTIFVQDWDIPWEVDDARRILEREVYPNVRSGAPASVEIRVSEPPQIRAELEEEIRAELTGRGVTDAAVHVLSAYKQGYSWIYDVLLPRLRDLPVASIDLTYHTLEESEEVRWQTIAAKTRWLQEVYPFDAVLSRELGIPDSVITFHPTREKDPIYTFEAMDASGSVILRESFDPHYVIRPFFDLFPEYEQVRVTTGWITATTGAGSGVRTLVDERIVTDPERFWDRLQTETYGKIIEYMMDSQEGEPGPGNAPFFDAFQVDLRLSEPDYRIGIDEEAVSSLEALHEDIFFETHTLFTLLGGRYQTSFQYPGRVLPFMDPTGAGRPGHARLTLTGKERGNPKLLVRTFGHGDAGSVASSGSTGAVGSAAASGAEPRLQEYELSPLPIDPPRLVGAVARAGQEGLGQLLVRVAVTDSVDRFDDFEGRSSEAAIDRQFISTELLAGMLSSLERLHDAGLVEDALSWDRVGALALDFRMEKDSTYQRTVILPRSQAPKSTDNPVLLAEGWRYRGEPLVQTGMPMPPEENEEILAKLATFPGVDVYYLTQSFLGERVWAADFLSPHEAEYVSQAKLNALKPTLFVSGREHANEVSSTTHILRLAELLVTDSTYRAMLDEVNVVLHSMTNVDGARLAVDRHRVNPNHMVHAARPGALGVDATVGMRDDDAIYPESQARRLIREAWLPDVYLNPHGYPSHEWVQYFAGYSAWVRSRRGGARDWWVPRSWFIPGFSWVDDEDNPDYKKAQFAMLDTMAAAMTGHEEVDEVNRRLYHRYRKYEVQDREGFTEYFHNGMLVNMRLRGAESIGTGVYSPRITYFSATTEAPDEIARGEWLRIMVEMGITHTSSMLRYLATGEYDVERESEAFDGAVTRKIFRVRPVLPPGEKEEDEEHLR